MEENRPSAVSYEEQVLLHEEYVVSEVLSTIEVPGVNNTINDEVQSKHININGMSPSESSININTCEQVNLMGATADESMAVEALSQLGGMFNMTDIHELNDSESTDLSPLCETCGMQFRSAYELQNHSSVCQVVGSYVHVCNVCGESFDRKIDLGNHISCHQPVERQHSCRICASSFTRKSDLVNHMSSHQTSRPHQCTECGVDFQRPSSLTNHMKIHKYHPGRSMLTATDTHISRQSNCNSLKMPNYILPEAMEEFSSFGADEDNVIPPAEYHETVEVLDCQESNENAFQLGLPSYESWNTKASNSDPLTESNSNITYQQQFTQQLDGTQDMDQFNYFQDIIECTTVDVETTAMTSSICESNDHNVQVEQMDFVGNMDNAAVKVEAVPYFLPRENETGESMTSYTIDSPLPVNKTNSRLHRCNECGVTFTRFKTLQSHALLHQDNWPDTPATRHECRKCSEEFGDAAHLKLHEQFCTYGETVPSNHASTNSDDVVQTQGKLGKHPCVSCDKKFTTKQKLFRHMWIHRKKYYVCEICSLSLNTQDALDSHRRSVHPGDPPFVCQTCGKSFASRQGVWEHRRVHGTTKVSLYWCHECNKSFSSRQGYLIHTRTHTGERPYGCRYCMKAFRDGGTLRKHERIHTGERPHVCPLCYRAFNQKVVLREHVRWVHAANRSGLDNDDHVYMCQVCDQTLGDREELCAHIVKHSDDLAKAAKNKEQPVALLVSNSMSKRNHVNNKVSLKKKKKRNAADTLISKTASLKVPSLEEVPARVPKSRSRTKRLTYQLEVAAAAIKKEHICGMCDETFIDKVQLMDHVRIHI